MLVHPVAAHGQKQGEDVDPALEAQSNEKKQKELEELRGINDDIDGNEPSEALIAACEAVLGKRYFPQKGAPEALGI